MKTKLKLEINSSESDFLNVDSSMFFYLESDSNNVEEDEFNISNLDIKKFTVTYTERDIFTLDLFSYIKRPKEDCTFIQLFCYLSTSNPRTLPIPRRFKLKVNSDEDISFSAGGEFGFGDPSWLTLGKMSQFMLSNVAESECDYLVSNFEISSGETVNFIVIVGLKN